MGLKRFRLLIRKVGWRLGNYQSGFQVKKHLLYILIEYEGVYGFPVYVEPDHG